MIGQKLLDIRRYRLVYKRRFTQAALTLSTLLGQNVVSKGFSVLQLAGFTQLEPLGGPAVGLDLGHIACSFLFYVKYMMLHRFIRLTISRQSFRGSPPWIWAGIRAFRPEPSGWDRQVPTHRRDSLHPDGAV